METREVMIELISYEGALFDDPKSIANTKSSIQEIGLLHPIAVRQGKTLGNFDLVTGRKRLAAFKELDKKMIPAQVFSSDLTIDQCRNIALHENLRRNNIPWYDLIDQEAELHRLRIKQHGQAPSHRPRRGGKDGWSLRDTATELGIAVGVLSEDINLALAVSTDPSLKNIKDKSTALKMVKLKAKSEIARAESMIPSDTEMNQVLLGDSNDILKYFPNNTFDLCITDPPWSEYSDPNLVSDDRTIPVFTEIYRTLKADSFLYCVLSSTDFPQYLAKLKSLGFHVQKYPIIWKKNGTITHGRRPWEYARDFEVILLAAKGNPVLTTLQELSSVIETGTVHYTRMIHPNEKPISLIDTLLSNSSYQGAKVLDPFAGSGVVAESCIKNKREYILIERNQKFYQNIVNRIEEYRKEIRNVSHKLENNSAQPTTV